MIFIPGIKTKRIKLLQYTDHFSLDVNNHLIKSNFCCSNVCNVQVLWVPFHFFHYDCKICDHQVVLETFAIS